MATTGDAVLGQFKPTEHNDSEECCCGKKLKVGIIGTGWIAEAHIESYLRMPDVEIVAGADLIDGKTLCGMSMHSAVRFTAERLAARLAATGCIHCASQMTSRLRLIISAAIFPGFGVSTAPSRKQGSWMAAA